MAEHRVPVLGGSLHRYVDPARSNDPRIRAVVAALGTLQDNAPAPRAHFRAELRAQLVAVAPRLVAEGPTAELVRHTPESVVTAQTAPAVASRAARVRIMLDRLPSIRLGRAGAIVAAAVAVVAMVLSGAVWISRSALPGDTLYGLKRASEDAQLSLTTGNVARGKELLTFAKTRADEVSALIGAAPATSVSPHTAGLVTSTLDSADDDVRQAAQLLGTQSVQSVSAAPLSNMTSWAPGQLARLQAIVSRIPAGSSLHARAVSSANLVSAALARAQTLQSQLGCTCLNGGGSDQLGPLPCLICTGPAPLPITVPGSTPTPGGAVKGTGKSSPAQTNGSGSAAATPGNGGSSASPSQSGSVPGLVLPSLSLPSLPLPTIALPTSPPLTINSCGVGLTLGPIGVGAGTCGIHLHI